MRKVLVKTRTWVPDRNSPAKGSYESHDYFAVFHDYALDTDTSSTQYEIYPVGIIERADGTLETIHVRDFTFINPTSFETCESH